MKKVYLIIAAAVVLVATIVLSFAFFGGVNVKVSDEQIENRILYNKISNKAYSICFKNQKDLYKDVERPTSRSEVKKQLKKDLTVCYLCEEKEILLSDYDARQIAEAEFEALKTNEDQKTFYDALVIALDEFGVSEEKYLELTYFEAYCIYNRYTLKTDFEHTEYDSESKKSFDEQFDEYIKDNMAFGIFY